jgi:hypothetical protein
VGRGPVRARELVAYAPALADLARDDSRSYRGRCGRGTDTAHAVMRISACDDQSLSRLFRVQMGREGWRARLRQYVSARNAIGGERMTSDDGGRPVCYTGWPPHTILPPMRTVDPN